MNYHETTYKLKECRITKNIAERTLYVDLFIEQIAKVEMIELKFIVSED